MLFKKKLESKIDFLQKIIDSQSKELSKLHWASLHIEEYEKKQKELQLKIKEHEKLCQEAKKQIETYKKLNKELSNCIYSCREEKKKIEQYLRG